MKLTLTLILTILLLSGCSQGAAQGNTTGIAERGKYLVATMGCNHCHTPYKLGPKGPEPDMTLMLSGHPQSLVMPTPPAASGPWVWTGAITNTAFAGPWGISYAFNLTPDEHTGIGIWTEDIFMKTMRTGRHWGTSRPILPPMPWENLNALTDDDLRALFAYLRTIPAVSNHVPDPVIAGENITE